MLAELALIGVNSANSLDSQEAHDAWLLPRPREFRVLVKKVLTIRLLNAVELDAEFQVLASNLFVSVHFLRVHAVPVQVHYG